RRRSGAPGLRVVAGLSGTGPKRANLPGGRGKASLMIRIRAASRLHFGLLSFPPDETAGRWANVEGQNVIPLRRYGGVGLMVENPGLSLVARQAASWQARGPLAERVLDFARRMAEGSPAANSFPREFMIAHCAPEHCGLGTGTQLALAVARSLIRDH